MCGICGVVAHQPDELADYLLELTEKNLNRGQDAIGNILISPETGTQRRYVYVRKPKSDESPMIPGFRIEIQKLAHEIDARMAMGETKWTTVGLTDDEDVVRDNTQPLHLLYKRELLIPEASIVANGEISIPLAKEHIKTPSASKATVDTRFLGELFYDLLRETGDYWKAAERLMELLPKAYAAGFSVGENLFFFTNHSGRWPLVVGRKEGKHGPLHVVNSEDGPFGELGIERLYHLEGGEAVLLAPGKEPEKRTLFNAEQRPCWINKQYVEQPQSTARGETSNAEYRRREARAVGELYKTELAGYDIVFSFPNTGVSFENGIVDTLGSDVLHLNASWKPGRGKQRYFLTARLDPRHRYEFNRLDIEGKDGIVVDDTIIGADSAAQLFLDWKRYGGERLALVSCGPPVLFSCPDGAGLPKQEKMITYGAFQEGVARMEEDGVVYDVIAMNEYVTNRLHQKIRQLHDRYRENNVAEYDFDFDVRDLRVFYGTIDIIRDHAPLISRSGKQCDYCASGVNPGPSPLGGAVEVRVTAAPVRSGMS